MTSCLVLTSRSLPRDSRQRARPGRDWAAAIFAWLRAVLALDPVRDLVKSVDRMPIRSLLKLRGSDSRVVENRTAVLGELQPDPAWTINRKRWAPKPNAVGRVNRTDELRELGTTEHTLSRVPRVAESPTPRTSATHDETRAIDQRGAARDACRDPGGRRAS